MKQNKKPNTKKEKITPQRDDLLHVWGNAYAGLILYKAATVILAIVTVALSFCMVILAQKANDVKPLPIFIDRNTGIAEPVSFELIDAAGEKRYEVEVKDFVRNYLEDLYTFNVHTAKNNLEKCNKKTAGPAWSMVKEILLREKRTEMVDQGNQGLVEIKTLIVQSLEPEIAIQVVFKKVELSSSGNESAEFISVIKLQTVKRYEGNAHGLMVVEYRETKNA